MSLLPELARYNIENLINTLSVDGGRDLITKALVSMLTLAGLTIPDLQEVSEATASFSKAHWDKVAPHFGLDVSQGIHQLGHFSVPKVSLPPSFHREVMRNSAQWLDVYQETEAHNREDARVRLMDAWHVPVCALFKGRVVDRPESSMPATMETSGGVVEHEVYMLEGIILIVAELKLYFKNPQEHLAQVLLELASAFKLNKVKEFENQPPVYAVLTDMRDFYFLRYDGSKFELHHHEIIVSAFSRSAFLDGMRNVTEHLFSIILEGYISNLSVVQNRSSLRGANGDVSEHNSVSVGKPKITTPMASQPSFENWTRALSYAMSAQDALVKVDFTSFESWENAGAKGLLLLHSSVSQLKKIGFKTDWSKKELDLEIDRILGGLLKVPSQA